MSEQQNRRVIDKAKFWIGAFVFFATTFGIAYGWYFSGKSAVKDVEELKQCAKDHEKRIVEVEQFKAVQIEINKKLETMDSKLDRLLKR